MQYHGEHPHWEHQRQAIEKAGRFNLDYYNLLFDPGTGKTRTAIDIFRWWCLHQSQLLPTVIFCPPVVIKNWKDEFAKWAPKIPQEKIILLNGSGKKRTQLIEKYMGETVIFVTNYESLTMGATRDKKGKYIPGPVATALQQYKPYVCIWDEMHKLKNYKAHRTKQATRLSDTAVKHLGLTGTPVLNNSLDLFSQFRVTTKGTAFGHNFMIFRNRYFIDRNAGMPSFKYYPNWQPIESMEPELREKIANFSQTAKKEECLDLPPLVTKDLFVDLSTEQAKHYRAMKDELITFLRDKACVANLALTKALRLQQIASGFLSLEDENLNKSTVRFKNVPRLQALKELLEDLAPHHKVIVWAVFKENYEMIRQVCAKLDLDAVELHGGVGGKKREENIRAFKEDKETRVLIGHPLSGGIGVNLQESDIAIWFSRNFSLECYLQARARNHRGGSEIHTKVTEINLVAPETIDEQVLYKVQHKKQIADSILDLQNLLGI